MTGGSDERASEFRKAMAETVPLEDRDKLLRPKALRRRRPQLESDSGGVRFEIDRLGERIEGWAPGVDRAVRRKLRNAEFPLDARVDLHGLDTAAARRSVHETLERVHAEGGRCVLVIHGRGHGSADGPVLKEALTGWLAEPPSAARVLAFASASGGHGGVGATYVLLRRERSVSSHP